MLFLQATPVPRDATVHNLLVLGRPGRGNDVLDTFYNAQVVNFASFARAEAESLQRKLDRRGHFPKEGTMDELFHDYMPAKYKVTTVEPCSVSSSEANQEAQVDDIAFDLLGRKRLSIVMLHAS